jgi:DNA invertase Pin-like site-specific DNA recombinase
MGMRSGDVADNYIGLVRVSTKGQEESGLGLLAGRDDIDRYVESVGGVLVTVLEEVESGKHDKMINRPVLLKALALCKRHKAILLVPKVDRLVRSTQVHSDIKRSGVSFRAVDNPHANEFTLDILVAVAANEARAISDRTKKSLKAYRQHKKVSQVQMTKLILKYGRDIPPAEIDAASDKEGMARLIARYGHHIPPEAMEAVAGKLGSHITGVRLTEAQRAMGRAKAGAKRASEAVEVYEDLVPEMRAWRAESITLAAIADRLNERGDRTRTGVPWTKVQVKRLLDRAAKMRKALIG